MSAGQSNHHPQLQHPNGMLTSWDIFPASRTTWFIQCVLHHTRLQKLYFHSNFGAGNELLGSLSNHDDDFKKTNIRFNDQNNSSPHASRFLVHFFARLRRKPPNLTLYGGRGHTTTNFSLSF